MLKGSVINIMFFAPRCEVNKSGEECRVYGCEKSEEKKKKKAFTCRHIDIRAPYLLA